MCFLLKNNDQVSNTRATKRAAGVKSLKVRILLYNFQKGRLMQWHSEMMYVYAFSAPSKTKSIGFLLFGEEATGPHSLKSRTAHGKET